MGSVADYRIIRFFSCPVDKNAYLWPVLRYIERNPVRTGLARLPWEYQWSSARHHVLEEPDPTVAGPDWLREEMRKTDYRSYVQRGSRPSVTTAIRRMTATGRPLGNVKFTAVLESKLGRELTPARIGRPRRSTQEE
jgi:putative transposase